MGPLQVLIMWTDVAESAQKEEEKNFTVTPQMQIIYYIL